jgi:hypothetical protein
MKLPSRVPPVVGESKEGKVRKVKDLPAAALRLIKAGNRQIDLSASFLRMGWTGRASCHVGHC